MAIKENLYEEWIIKPDKEHKVFNPTRCVVFPIKGVWVIEAKYRFFKNDRFSINELKQMIKILEKVKKENEVD